MVIAQLSKTMSIADSPVFQEISPFKNVLILLLTSAQEMPSFRRLMPYSYAATLAYQIAKDARSKPPTKSVLSGTGLVKQADMF